MKGGEIMETEVRISPIQAVEEAYCLMTQVAKIEPDGARSVTRQARHNTFFAVLKRKAVERGLTVVDKPYQPDREETTAYAIEQVEEWKTHLTAMVQYEGADMPETALQFAQSMAFAMRNRLNELTGKRED